MRFLTLLFLLAVGMVGMFGSLRAQSDRENVLLKARAPFDAGRLNSVPMKKAEVLEKMGLNLTDKTSETIVRDTQILTGYWEDETLPDDVCLRYRYFPNADPGFGYINGSMRPFFIRSGDTDSVEIVIQDHANSFNIPRRNGFPKIWLEELIVGMPPNCSKIGDADTFRIRVFPISDLLRDGQGNLFGARTESVPVVEQPWTLDRFPGGNTRDLSSAFVRFPILTYDPYPPTNTLRGGYLFSFETKRAYGGGRVSDDTLTTFFSLPAGRCDPNNEYDDWYVSIVGIDTPQVGIWRTLQTFFYNEAQRPNALDQPAIFPVIYYEGTVSMDEPIYQSGKLNFYGAYPNPAPEFFNIVFEYTRNAMATFILTDLNGKVVYESESLQFAPGKHQHTIPTRNLPCGVYSYLIKSNQGSMGGKVTIDR